MGNGSSHRPDLPKATPCTACTCFGGWKFGKERRVICDSDKSGGCVDHESGCRFWMEAGARAGGKRVIVCGGRDYRDKARVHAALEAAHAKAPIGVLVHGGASGADLIAMYWAKGRGILREEHPALWDDHGHGAGPLRNQAMADAGADGCIAFPGGRGTADMVQRAQAAGIPVWRPFA
jgi:hypothetical protein